MRIGVTGASGILAGLTLGHLRARAPGAELIGITRSPETLRLPGVTARMGDFDRPAALADALAGIDRLLIVPTIDMRPGARTRQHQDAVRAAVTAGVGHIVFLSATHPRPGPLNTMDDCYFLPEQLLMREAPRWSVLRMSLYAEYLFDRGREALARGRWLATSEGRVTYVARDDIAAAAAGILSGDGHHGAIYTATGAQSWGQAEKAALLSQIFDSPVPVERLSMADYEARLKSEGFPEIVIEVFRHHELHTARGGFDIVTGDVERLAGRPPEKTEDFLRAAMPR
jgi:NAD(P)H dehydrogenase (quinone)